MLVEKTVNLSAIREYLETETSCNEYSGIDYDQNEIDGAIGLTMDAVICGLAIFGNDISGLSDELESDALALNERAEKSEARTVENTFYLAYRLLTDVAYQLYNEA